MFGVMNQQFHDYFDEPLRHNNLDDEKLSRARIHMMLYKDFTQIKNAIQLQGVQALRRQREDKKCKKHIDPDSILARNWSILLLLCLAWVAVIMPFILGFVEEP